MSFFSPNNILNHLYEYIPRLSDRFSDNALVSAQILAGTPQILRVTDNAHGLIAGDLVVLFDGKINNPIVNVEFFSGDNILRFTTQGNHDLTQGYTVEVQLSGFTNPALNGTFPLIAVPNRNTFEIEGTALPTLNGNEVLTESRELGIDGLFTISNVVDVNTYDISLDGRPEFTIQTVPVLKRAKDFRMGVSVDARRAEALYTKQADKDHLWMFVIMGDATASKNRDLTSDANQTNTPGSSSRILLVNTFSLVVFYPTETETAAAIATDLSWNEILKLMLASTSGIKFEDFGNTNYITTLLDHGTSIYTNAYYSHAYTFEYNYQITQEQQFLTQFIESAAFRDIATSFDPSQDGSGVDLDNE